MKYKGFVIEPVYVTAADIRFINGAVVGRVPTSKDIDYYNIVDPFAQDEFRWSYGDTVQECKEEIDKFLAKVNLKKWVNPDGQ